MPQDQRSIGEMIMECELHWRVQLPEGYTPDLQYMAHLWEPLRTMHHPLCLHLGSEAAHLTCAAALRMQGFRSFRSQVRNTGSHVWTHAASCAVCPARTDPAAAREARLHRRAARPQRSQLPWCVGGTRAILH